MEPQWVSVITCVSLITIRGTTARYIWISNGRIGLSDGLRSLSSGMNTAMLRHIWKMENPMLITTIGKTSANANLNI